MQLTPEGEEIRKILEGEEPGRLENETTPSGETVGEIAQKADTPLSVAQSFLGKDERNHTKVLSDFIKNASGININPAKTAWCAAFMNAVLNAAGEEGSSGNRLAARSFQNYGQDVTQSPEEGDIAVFWRESPNSWKGHVGFFMGFTEDGKRIKVLGGNQKNSVSEQLYSADQLLSIRRPNPIQ